MSDDVYEDYEDEHWVWRSLRWWRDEAGAFFSVFGMCVAVYAVGLGLLAAFLQLDATFSRPLAGDVIEPHVTQNIAWALRAWSVIAGMVTIYCLKNNMKGFARLAGVLGGAVAILLLFHAYGVAAKIMEGQYSKAEVVKTLQSVDEKSIAAQIATFEKQKDGWRQDTANVVASNKEAIDNITSDGLDNDDEATVLQKANKEAQQRLSDKIDEADAEIRELQKSLRESSKTTEQKSSQLNSFDPLFTLMARASTGNFDPARDPPDGHKYVSGVIFFTGFFGLGEILVIATFTLGFAMLIVARERARAQNKQGTVKVKFTPEEWEEWQHAKQKHDNQKAGAERAAETRRVNDIIKITDKEYGRQQRRQIEAYAAGGKNVLEIMELMKFDNLHEFNARLTKLFLPQELDALFGDQDQEPPVAAE